MTCAMEACRELGWSLEKSRVVIQGYGNVGSVSARIARELGALIVGVSDRSGGIYSPAGIDLDSVDEWIAQNSVLEGYRDADSVTNAELLELDCDILIPAALQHQITEENAGRLKCRMIVEGANGPTTLEADEILRQREIFVVPDILANAGGVTVSYFEWVQGLQHFLWSEHEINTRLIELMRRAYSEVHGLALQMKTDLRTAALIRGIDRVKEAKRRRGIFP